MLLYLSVDQLTKCAKNIVKLPCVDNFIDKWYIWHIVKIDNMSFLIGDSMALVSFYNLKDKKKDAILYAIFSCLRKTSYDNLSVNDIVLEADISRGSFYNYFIDKNDAIVTLVESKLKKYSDRYVEAIKASEYNLFEGTKKLYYEIKDILEDEINITFMRNMKFFMEIASQALHSENHKKNIKEFVDWLVENTNEGKTILKEYNRMRNIIDLLLTLIMESIFIQMQFKDDKEVTTKNFNFKLDIIKNGIKNS